jgi:hypothetical protein
MTSPTPADFENAFQAEEFMTRLVPAGDEVPVDQLMVTLEDADYRAWAWWVELMYLPDLKGPTFLQFFAPLPFTYSSERAAEVARFCHNLNGILPLNGFGISEEHEWIYYRQLMPCPDSGADSNLVVQTTWAIWYVIDRFGGLLKDIVEGSTNLEQARAALEHNLKLWTPEDWGKSDD